MPSAMASTDKPICHCPLAVCIGIVSPATARIAKNGMTRRAISMEGWYNLGTHYPWIGDRTRDITAAHVEYFRGIKNPIGIKLGPSATPEALALLKREYRAPFVVPEEV